MRTTRRRHDRSYQDGRRRRTKREPSTHTEPCALYPLRHRRCYRELGSSSDGLGTSLLKLGITALDACFSALFCSLLGCLTLPLLPRPLSPSSKLFRFPGLLPLKLSRSCLAIMSRCDESQANILSLGQRPQERKCTFSPPTTEPYMRQQCFPARSRAMLCLELVFAT